MAGTKIAGVDVLIYVKTGPTDTDLTVLGGQSNATLNRSTNIVNATSKDDGGWAANLAGINSWGLECEGYLMASDAALDQMETIWASRQTVLAEIRMPSGKKYTGECIISDFPAEFPQEDAATYKLSFTGTGALTVVPAA
ncbi:Predicted secreted protein [Desulfotomaculum arcticum]|uniref:Predicted secreted protein n=1 Tax=Desulfotruncus arcticus DSM 17038 TaxID=1121424 RepID=A0A1I2YBE1_9FIRM|nr:phage tail protein [Desulfotruncus arcticus]SFH22993.1 Predicted secreted protein [Desulfotomaculum arcticum] [Desulfotruncus arcticus DSM 17038]